MMNIWQHFYELTDQLLEKVEQPVTENKRPQMVTEVEEILAKRAQLLSQLPQPDNSKEEELVQQVIKKDLIINQKLEFLFDGLKRSIRNTKKQKSSQQRYVNPYQNVSNYDGMYLDHKK